MSARRGDGVEEGPGRVLSVHFGRSANCSSVGSIIDFLFLSTVAGAAIVAATAILLRDAEDADGEGRAGDADPRSAPKPSAETTDEAPGGDDA